MLDVHNNTQFTCLTCQNTAHLWLMNGISVSEISWLEQGQYQRKLIVSTPETQFVFIVLFVVHVFECVHMCVCVVCVCVCVCVHVYV